MAQSPNVFNDHGTSSNMSPGTAAHNLKSPAVSRSRSVSDSSVPQRGMKTILIFVLFKFIDYWVIFMRVGTLLDLIKRYY